MSATCSAIIFDLDGTLVDSADGILSSFAVAFDMLKIQPVCALTPTVIGPPLMQTLQKLAGDQSPEVIAELASAFKSYYDTTGCLQTIPYPGVEGMLSSVSEAGVPLILATNKRSVPTQSILNQFSWGNFFSAIYSLDSLDPPAQDKGYLLAHIVSGLPYLKSTVLYVGDRHEDALAALFAKIRFFHATWGYESSIQTSHYEASGDLRTLRDFLRL